MYLSKNSRFVFQKTPWLSSGLVKNCSKRTGRHYSAKLPKDDPTKPPLRLNIPKDPPVDPYQFLFQLSTNVELTSPEPTPRSKSLVCRTITPVEDLSNVSRCESEIDLRGKAILESKSTETVRDSSTTNLLNSSLKSVSNESGIFTRRSRKKKIENYARKANKNLLYNQIEFINQTSSRSQVKAGKKLPLNELVLGVPGCDRTASLLSQTSKKSKKSKKATQKLKQNEDKTQTYDDFLRFFSEDERISSDKLLNLGSFLSPGETFDKRDLIGSSGKIFSIRELKEIKTNRKNEERKDEKTPEESRKKETAENAPEQQLSAENEVTVEEEVVGQLKTDLQLNSLVVTPDEQTKTLPSLSTLDFQVFELEDELCSVPLIEVGRKKPNEEKQAAPEFRFVIGDMTNVVRSRPKKSRLAKRLEAFRSLKPLSKQVAVVDEIPENLRYPELKYVGLRSKHDFEDDRSVSRRSVRAFHNSSSCLGKLRNDTHGDNRSLVILDNISKSEEVESCKDPVSIRQEVDLPSEMNQSLQQNEVKDDPNLENIFGPVPSEKNEIKLQTQLNVTHVESTKEAIPEMLFNSGFTNCLKNNSFETVGGPKKPSNKDSLTEEKDLTELVLGGQNDQKGRANPTEGKTPKPGVKSRMSASRIRRAAKTIVLYPSVQTKSCTEKKTRKEKIEHLSKLKPADFELNPACVTTPRASAIPQPMTHPKDVIMNVSKSTEKNAPKISDNIANVANEHLTEDKGRPSVDSLNMMKKVKEMLSVDLENAVKLFQGPEETPKETKSVVCGNDATWVWKVNQEELEKHEKSLRRVETQGVSALCQNDGKWSVDQSVIEAEILKIGETSSGKSAVTIDEESKCCVVDAAYLAECQAGSKEENFGDWYKCEASESKPPSGDVEQQSIKENECETRTNSVVVLNPETNRFRLDEVGLQKAIRQIDRELKPNSKSSIVVAGDSFKIDENFLDSLKFEAKAENETKIPRPANATTKPGESILVYDEDNKTWKVDYTLLRPDKREIEKELNERSERILEAVEKKEKEDKAMSEMPPSPTSSRKKVFDYTSRSWKEYEEPKLNSSSERKADAVQSSAEKKRESPREGKVAKDAGKSSDVSKTVDTERTEPDKKFEDHYISENILERSKASGERVQKVKASKVENVKLNMAPSTQTHTPSQIKEINLNKKCDEAKKDDKTKDPAKKKKPAEKVKKEKSENTPVDNGAFYKKFEKYRSPFSEPDFEDKPVKINTDPKSNPNLKKLDNLSKTMVLHDLSKQQDSLEGWLRDETDKMTTLLIKVLQEAAEGKTMKRIARSCKADAGRKNPYGSIRKKQENSASNVKLSKKSEKIPVKRPETAKAVPKPEQSSFTNIPLQSASDFQTVKVVEAVKVSDIDSSTKEALNKRSNVPETTVHVNQEMFDLPDMAIDPVGINMENMKDLKINKIKISKIPSADKSRKSSRNRLKLMQRNRTREIRFPKNEDGCEVEVLSPDEVLPAVAREDYEVTEKIIPLDDIPGPVVLKKISAAWRYLPQVGCQATIVTMLWIHQTGKSFLGDSTRSRYHKRPFSKLFSKYGPIVKLQGPLGGEVVLINKPEHIAAVFEHERKFPIRSALDSVDRCMQTQWQTCYGFHDLFGFEENTMENDYAIKGPEMYFRHIEESGQWLVNRIRAVTDAQQEVSGDFMTDINRWSLECLCGVTLNKSQGYLRSENYMWSSEPERLLRAIKCATQCLCSCESGLQFWRFMETPASYNLTVACQAIEGIVTRYIQQAQMNLLKRKNEVVSIQQLQEENLAFIESMLLEKMMPSEVLSTILDIFLIGVNTTSSALGFLLYQLATNQRVQRILFREVKEVLPGKDSRLEYHQLHSLKYLQACLKESLRLNMPMPILIKVLPVELILSNYRIPQGTYLVMDTQAACLKEQSFEEPDKFIPERWLESPNMHPFYSVPFCHGPREGFGKRLAEIQLWSCAAKVIRNFRLDYNYSKIESTENVISFPDKPLKLSFVEREE